METQDLFKGKYRVKSSRATWHGYQDGLYFITVCTKNGAFAFGHVHDGEMKLSDLGRYAEECIVSIPLHFPYVSVGRYVVMPNHVHVIMGVNDSADCAESFEGNWTAKRHPHFSDLAQAISRMKAAVKRYATQQTIPFEWQTRYHDHIIRNGEEYSRIEEYIGENPLRWAEDCYHHPCSTHE